MCLGQRCTRFYPCQDLDFAGGAGLLLLLCTRTPVIIRILYLYVPYSAEIEITCRTFSAFSPASLNLEIGVVACL